MILPDTNLLLYFINSQCREHSVIYPWWKKVLEDDEPIGLCYPVIFAFIRLSTQARILSSPLQVEEAFAYVENWLAFPSVVWLEPGAEYFTRFQSLLVHAGTAANLVTDAQIAALALEHDAIVYSADMDFLRFPKLKFKNPLV
jgi:uncharacterized protein